MLKKVWGIFRKEVGNNIEKTVPLSKSVVCLYHEYSSYGSPILKMI